MVQQGALPQAGAVQQQVMMNQGKSALSQNQVQQGSNNTFTGNSNLSALGQQQISQQQPWNYLDGARAK